MDHSQNMFAHLNGQSPFYSTIPGMGMHHDMTSPLDDMLSPLIPAATTSVDPSVISNQPISMAGIQQPYGQPMTHQMCTMAGDHIDAYAQPHAFPPTAMLHRNSDLGPLSQDNSSFAQLQLRRGSASVTTDQKQQQLKEQEFYNEDFRFHAVLRAATAMIRDPDEIPITYLNKGQAYTLTIFDSAALSSPRRPTKYRTYIRVSFEEEEQRSKPASCWQLWQEGRGANEAHHRDGKLLAVEHVDPNQGGDGDLRHQQVQLESENFDGFSVVWTPNRINGRHECTISVRFNFLSTDFSHSKGVKGIPVRLCAKTQVVSGISEIPVPEYAEVSYCKVKLFRDHGAERKLSNDATHVKKQIEKTRSQILQAESGAASGEKRKRSGSISRGGSGNKVSKTPKSKRSWSQGQGEKAPFEDDLHSRLQSFMDMFRSVRHASVLNLKGDPEDDPDAYPVRIDQPSENNNSSNSNNTSNIVTTTLDWDPSQATTAPTTNDGANSHSFSPASSHRSITSSGHSFDVKPNLAANGVMFGDSRHGSVDWSGFASHDPEIHPKHGQILNHPIKIQRQGATDANDGWFEAMGVDPNYNPPSDAVIVPKHCFYVKASQNDDEKTANYHHAIYIQQRNSQEFVEALARKWKLDPANVIRTIQVRDDGLSVIVDDDVVRELPEGKDMVAEFLQLREESEGPNMDVDSPVSPGAAGPVEIRLKF
ncbi:hypothetical protein H112_07622 [Trichophyton rubrum D6]|nr:hypothetical protein H100_07648 [Trichophyton rubrum MR850]EZF38129.1 hypothetical protein H102_07612 [Trichophyton rubrum CBS 100081]EZF48816.1 hypothetical protein H103_07635 [Trichophyton rubrum CBS 288.86]EZF70118.1 hypothetical protein H105_07638 [Trichophyton soudanense CBS 452.61]EZF80738.1 hypothetical protein H110_07632 [Trichophyton rubrum MR1448]KDB29889.1 hypothetical protein H112_07622 [Trichophyton rubrum D6]